MAQAIEQGVGERPLTYEDYLALPEDGPQHQLVEGRLFVSPAPLTRHQRIVGNLFYLLVRALREAGAGEVLVAPTDVVLDAHNVLQPDVLFVRAARAGIVGERAVEGAPDLVVEVLSPSTRRLDIRKKMPIYARFGVPSVWIADPDIDRLELYRLEGSAYVLEARVDAPAVARPQAFPGVELPLDEVFPSPERSSGGAAG